MNDYMIGIAEIDQHFDEDQFGQGDQEETGVPNEQAKLIVTEKERIITSDRDLKTEPVLTPEDVLLAKQ